MSSLSRSCRSVGLAATLALLLLSSGCAREGSPSGPETDPGEAEAPLQVTVVTLGLILDRITAEVTAPDIPTPLVFNLPLANGVASGIIRLPPGDARTITLRAYDETGQVTHEGSRTITVRPGMNMPTVQITLRARAGQVPISGTLGTYALEVVSVDGNDFIGAGQSEQYTVQVLDLASATPVTVSPADIEWAVSNPAFATVSASGLVTGVVSSPQFYVVATYEGAAGVAPLTVLAPNTGIVRGTVSSPQRGPLQVNFDVGDSFGGNTFGSTTTAGVFQTFPLPSGPASLLISNVPAGCTAPGGQPFTIPNGGEVVVNVSVTCTP